MPRDGSDIYHRPPGTDAVIDTTIESTKYNNNVADVENDLNYPRPIVAGGTGGTSPDTALQNLSGEKAKQVVTNFDAMVWMPGSFYAANTALGAPVNGHAFAGIAYYANATDLVLEATDLTDADRPTKYVRTMRSGDGKAWTIASSGGSGGGGSIVGDYSFNTTTTFPPGGGQIRFNNATQNSTTEIFLSHTTAPGVDVTNFIPLAIKSGSDIAIQDKDDPTKYKVFMATADPVKSGSDFRIAVTFKSGGADLSSQRVLVGSSGTGGAVRYDVAQTLTAAQQVQARQNVYAAPFDALAYNGMQINGGCEISQERGGTSFVVPTGTPTYIQDGWRFYHSSSPLAVTAF